MEDVYFTGILPVLSDTLINLADVSDFFHWRKKLRTSNEIHTKAIVTLNNLPISRPIYSRIWVNFQKLLTMKL